MTLPDLVNGGFEAGAGAFSVLNCLALRRDQKVRGVSIKAVMFFTAWGFWNLFYYPNLHQWASFAGGLVIVSVNCVWVGMLLYYTLVSPARWSCPITSLEAWFWHRRTKRGPIGRLASRLWRERVYRTKFD